MPSLNFSIKKQATSNATLLFQHTSFCSPFLDVSDVMMWKKDVVAIVFHMYSAIRFNPTHPSALRSDGGKKPVRKLPAFSFYP